MREHVHDRDPKMEFIDVFTPDDGSPWESASPREQRDSTTTTPSPVSPKRVVLAGLFATACLIAGALAFGGETEPNSEASTTTQPTSTTIRSLLTPSPTTGYFLLDDPAFSPYSADLLTPEPSGGRLEVWVPRKAADRYATVVTIQVHPYVFDSYAWVGATRSVVDQIELIYRDDAPNTVLTELALPNGLSATLRAGGLDHAGLSEADFVRMATIVRDTGDLTTEMRRLEMEPLLIDTSMEGALFGRAESSVVYITDDGSTATLRSAPGSAYDYRRSALRAFAVDVNLFTDRRWSGRLRDGGDAIVLWREGDRLLSLVGPGSPADLEEASRRVRAASDNEWATMLYGLRPDFRVGEWATLNSDTTADDEMWFAGVQIAQRRGRNEFLWWWSVGGGQSRVESSAADRSTGEAPVVETVVVPGATYVFVSRPGEGAVTVTTAAGQRIRADLTHHFPQSKLYATVVRVTDPGLITVDFD